MNRFSVKAPLMVSAFLLISLAAGCSSTTIVSKNSGSEITADGNLNDWKTSSFTDAAGGKIKIAMAESGGCYFIAGKVEDSKFAKQISISGINLWISPDGSKTKDIVLETGHPASKTIHFYKGGFFAALNESRKRTALKAIDSLKDGVRIIDKKNSRVYNIAGADFKGKVNFYNESLSFEIMLPQRPSAPESIYNNLTGDSRFCLEFNNSRMEAMIERPYRPSPNDESSLFGLFGNKEKEKEFVKIPEIWFGMKGDR